MKFDEPQTATAFSRVWDLLKESRSPVFHAIGNHDLYNFKPSKLRARFNEDGGVQVLPRHIHVTCAAPQHHCFDIAIK